MFEHVMPRRLPGVPGSAAWSTLKKLIWLHGAGILGPTPILKTAVGNPIHITDALARAVNELKVAFSPIQDLHGYDNPWPAGGGKQKFNKDTATDGAYINASGTEVTHEPYGHSEIIAVEPNTTYYMSGYGGSGIYAILALDSDKNPIPTWYEGASKTAAFTATTPANCQYVILNYYAEQKDTVLFKVSDGDTTYAPYSNICPISGWTGANVWRTGKNLLTFLVTGHEPVGGVDFSYTQGVSAFTMGSELTNSAIGKRFGDTAKVTLPAGTYVISTDLAQAGTSNGIFVYNLTTSTVLARANSTTTTGNSFTLTEKTTVALGLLIETGTPAGTYHFQLELGSTASPYSPYSGSSVTIPFGQTVYGGTLDVTTGVLTIDKGILIKDTASMNYSEDNPGWKTSGIRALIGSGVNGYVDAVLNIGTRFGANTTGASGDILLLPKAIYGKTQSEWSALAMDVEFCVQLAEPVTIQLTPQELTLLANENILWSDTNGDLTLSYYADGNVSTLEALNTLLGGRYVNNHTEDEPSDEEALDIILGR